MWEQQGISPPADVIRDGDAGIAGSIMKRRRLQLHTFVEDRVKEPAAKWQNL
jgi:hypothetical protein